MDKKRLQNLNEISKILCNKEVSMSFDKCLNESSLGNKLCGKSKKCIIEEKTLEQTDYLLSNIKEHTYLEACPGSGKTEVVGLKAAYEINRWGSSYNGIAILSFTNNSTNEIRERVNKFVGEEISLYPHYIGTFDSWIHKYIAQPFGHLITGFEGKQGDKKINIVDENSNANWLKGLSSKTPYYSKSGEDHYFPRDILPNKIFYDYELDAWSFYVPFSKGDSLTAEEYFDSEGMKRFRKKHPWMTVHKIEESLSVSKNKFLDLGYATYYDMKCICYEILLDEKEIAKLIAKRFSFIIIDESQDLSWLDIKILEELIELGVKIHVIGDLDQSIYSFRNVFPENFVEFTKDKFNTLELNTNFRSCSEIINTCTKLLNKEKIEGLYDSEIKKPCRVYTLDYENLPKVPDKFIEILNNNNIEVKDSAILARGWSIIKKVNQYNSSFYEKKQAKLAYAVKNFESTDIQQLDILFRFLGEVLAELFFKDINCSKNNLSKPDFVDSIIKWREFLYLLLKNLNGDKDIKNMNITWSKWCKNVRVSLQSIIELTMEEIYIPSMSAIDIIDMDIKFNSPKGYSKKNVNDIMIKVNNTKSSIRKETIHQVKGETLNAVLLISASTASGVGDGYWGNWIKEPESEAGRFAYVASSRPKDLLIWLIPSKDKDRIEELGNYGFKYMGDFL